MFKRLFVLGSAVLLLTPLAAPAQQVSNIPRSYDVAGDSPQMYARYATVGPPSYLTSTQYPNIYGRWSYGTASESHGLYTGLPTPYTNYPETYTRHLPPVGSIYGPAYNYLTATRPELAPVRDVSMAALSTMASATIDIEVPETAQVAIQGRVMAERGTVRRFVSPRLNPNLAYSYDITASWREGDHDLSRTKRLIVRAGEQTAVSFVPTSGEPARPTLHTTGETIFPPSGTAGPSTLPPTGFRK